MNYLLNGRKKAGEEQHTKNAYWGEKDGRFFEHLRTFLPGKTSFPFMNRMKGGAFAGSNERACFHWRRLKKNFQRERRFSW